MKFISQSPAFLARRAVALAVIASTAVLLTPDFRSHAGETNPVTMSAQRQLESRAADGCIGGIGYEPERELSFEEQARACDTLVELSASKAAARKFRGLHLFNYGTTRLHRAQAFDDFTFAINAGSNAATVFRNRAFLHLKDRRDPEAALVDMNKGISLTSDAPRAHFFELRAVIFLKFAERDNDRAMAETALKDLRRVQSIAPERKRAAQIEAWAMQFLQNFPQKKDAS